MKARAIILSLALLAVPAVAHAQSVTSYTDPRGVAAVCGWHYAPYFGVGVYECGYRLGTIWSPDGSLIDVRFFDGNTGHLLGTHYPNGENLAYQFHAAQWCYTLEESRADLAGRCVIDQ